MGPTVINFPRLLAAYDFHEEDVQRVVPVVDMKLGLDYTYVFNNTANSDLTLEAGWHFSNYFNAIDRLQTTSPIILPPFLALPGAVTGRTTADYGIQGPYVTLVFHA